MSSASGTWQVFCCCFNEGYNSGELLLPICWKEVINKHTKGEEKGSFQAFLREDKRESRGVKNKGQAKKKNLSLVSLPDDDTRLQTHHEEDEEEDEEQQQEGRGRRRRPGGAPRGTGRRGHGTARHGTGERPANGLGRQRDPWILFFFLPECPFSSSRKASELLLPPRELPVP